MSEFNRVILLGYVGSDPTLKNTAMGRPYLRLSIATHSYQAAGQTGRLAESKKATNWHRVVVFGPQAQLCSAYLRKGSMVLVEGVLTSHVHTGDDGKKTNYVSIIAQKVQFFGGKASVEVQDEDNVEADETDSPSVQAPTEHAQLPAF